ncbi:pseudouridine synthase [Aquibium oceanicum]|uniref:Pseudouridine synthase n=1 Tax=Aquibium oceanicum TaxID=1670800 RepID=A0A1L3SV56_9HYPH|nr:pseudouridine synthase [Aquibium oceanicum]APH73231.1 hypothetical protein BSQ44_19030 [Aquibium oceanicum]
MDDDEDKKRRDETGAKKGGFRGAGEGPRKGAGKSFGGKKPGKPGARPAARSEGGDFRARKSDDGAKKPYKPRRPAEAGEGDARPQRRSGPPRTDRKGRKPFGEGKPAGERKVEAGGERNFRPRREDGAGAGDRKPFRGEGGARGDRAGFGARREEGPRPDFKRRDDRAPGGGDRRAGAGKPGFGEKRPFRDKPAGKDRPAGARADSSAKRPPRDDVRQDVAAPEEGERIAKRLARAGVASRRDAEALIQDGRIKLNGKVLTSPAINVTASDTITIDGQPIPAIERTRLFLFHKPAGLVTTNRDPQGRRTVFDVLPAELPRLMTVGRLDINTEGLLLLTNDGGLSRILELPATGWLRRYRVRVHGAVDEAQLASLREGIAVDGVFYGSVEATLDREQGSNAWLTLGLREGKNREVKNILAALGLEVTRLIRVSYGPFQLGELPEGAVQELKGRMLREQLGERLIEEAGANFDAPIVKPFSNKPTAGPAVRGEGRPEGQRGGGGFQEPGEGGLVKNRKRDREHRREDALGRLQTSKPPFRDKKRAGGDKREGEEKKFQPPRDRASNVWMAPGARPQGKKKGAEEEGAPEGESRPSRGQAKRDDRKPATGGRGEGGRFRSDRPKGDGGPGAGRSGPRKPRRGE